MRVLIQRVTSGKVTVKSEERKISAGYVILLGIADTDTEQESRLLAQKTVNLRVMADSEGKMNLSILQTKGDILVISQFTLYADLTAGRRPSFLESAKPEKAEKLYRKFIDNLKSLGVFKVENGEFGAYMKVELQNDGPVTIMIDSEDFRK